MSQHLESRFGYLTQVGSGAILRGHRMIGGAKEATQAKPSGQLLKLLDQGIDGP
jgi:hypothetical protein